MKTMLTIALVMTTFTLTMAADTCFAKKRRDMVCVAEKVEGRQVTLKCSSKDAKRFETGAKYKVRRKPDEC